MLEVLKRLLHQTSTLQPKVQGCPILLTAPLSSVVTVAVVQGAAVPVVLMSKNFLLIYLFFGK